MDEKVLKMSSKDESYLMLNAEHRKRVLLNGQKNILSSWQPNPTIHCQLCLFLTVINFLNIYAFIGNLNKLHNPLFFKYVKILEISRELEPNHGSWEKILLIAHCSASMFTELVYGWVEREKEVQVGWEKACNFGRDGGVGGRLYEIQVFF